MTYEYAKKKVHYGRLIGGVVVIVAFLFTVISVLKLLYFGLDNGDALSSAIARPVKIFVYFIYENTQQLSFFWEYAPTPNIKIISAQSNLWFLLSYISLFVGAAIFGSANVLARRLKIIEKQIEDEIIKSSISGNRKRSREEIRNSVEIPSPKIFKRVHELYLAPLIIGLLLALLVKLLGLL